MKRRFRLKHTNDFKRVRATGKAYTHPFFVLLVGEGESETSRLGISVHRGYGSAVARNLAKRRIRNIVGTWICQTDKVCDAVVIVRNPAGRAEYPEMQEALTRLFTRARLISNAEKYES